MTRIITTRVHPVRLLLAAAIAVAVWAASDIAWKQQPVGAAVGIFVNDTGDGSDLVPGDGVCKAPGSVCTLRAAIEEANALAGPDTILFSFGGTTVITPLTALPGLNTEITLDGTAGAGNVILSGSSAPAGSAGLVVNATLPVTIRDIEVTQWPHSGIYGAGSGALTVEGSVLSDNDVRGLWVTSGGPVDIGGTTTAEHNQMFLNGNAGIQVDAAATGVTLRGNAVGLSASGTSCAGNGGSGILVFSAFALIGGTVSGSRNVASCNTGFGVATSLSADGVSISGNWVGTDINGVAGFGNGAAGISASGVLTSLTVNTIESNSGAGIVLAGEDSVTVNSNFIVSNSGDGVEVQAGIGHAIYLNRMSSNGGLGIDLLPDGVTANDLGDGDAGANALQNFPVLTSARTNNVNIVDVVASLNSSPGVYLIDFYASPSCDPSGNGEGLDYIGSDVVSTDGNGDSGPFEWSSTDPVASGSAITATAINVAAGDTSEFSNCVTATACAGGDADCDGFDDSYPTLHQGPANTNSAVDNCIGVTNNLQLNSDGNFIDLTPPKANDDKTWAYSDADGDVCDIDADNDLLTDVFEFSAGCGVATGHLTRDTDFDRYLDGAECFIGTDATSTASKPTQAQCVTASGAASASVDTDLDGVKDHVEYCQYGSNPAAANSDGDVCNDGRETGNVDGNPTINAADLGLIASAVGPAYIIPYSFGDQWKWNMDVDKNGTVNSADLGLAAAKFGFCP